jgi:hypothetical protein
MATEIRRIVLALECAGAHPAAMRMALRLARRHAAELAGLLIEDINLLHAAALPFTREITLHGEERELEPEVLLRQLQRMAQELQRELARQAGELGVRMDFRTLRGVGIRAALETASEAELLVTGRPSRRRWPGGVHAPRVVLLAGSSEDFRRARELALALMEEEGAASPPREAPEWLLLPWPKAAESLDVLRGEQPVLIVAVKTADGESSEILQALLEVSECPVALLR